MASWWGSGRARRPLITLLFLSSLNFLDSYARYLISVASIPYIEYSSYEYSLLSGALFAIVYAAGGVLLSSHQLVNRRVVLALTISSLAFSVAFALTAITSAFWQLAIIRAAMGLANSLFTPLSTRILGSLFDESSRGLTFGLFNFSIYLAFAVCLSLGTYMYDMYGWQAGYILFGLLGILLSATLPCVLLCGSSKSRGGGGSGRAGLRRRLSSSGVTALTSSASAAEEEEEEGDGGGGGGGAVAGGVGGAQGGYGMIDGHSLGSPGQQQQPVLSNGSNGSEDERALFRATIAGSSSSEEPMRSRSHTSMSPQEEEDEEEEAAAAGRRSGGRAGGAVYTPLDTQDRVRRDANRSGSVDGMNSDSSMRWSGERLGAKPFFSSSDHPSADVAMLLASTESGGGGGGLPPLSQLEVMDAKAKRAARGGGGGASRQSRNPIEGRTEAVGVLLSVPSGGGDLEEVRLSGTPLKPTSPHRHQDADGLTVSSGRSGAPVYVEEDFDDEEGEGDEDGYGYGDYYYDDEDDDDDSVDTWTMLWPNYPPSDPINMPSGSGRPRTTLVDEGERPMPSRSVGSSTTATTMARRIVMHGGRRGGGGRKQRQSLWKAIKAVLKFWRRNPSLILLCLATGVRLGGGYIWSAYTSVFFSELYVDEGSDCAYSNPIVNASSVSSLSPSSASAAAWLQSASGVRDAGSSTYIAGVAVARAASGAVCDEDYPYCVGGICKNIAETPWHNKGMSHEKLESYMSWVPLVGSGLGSVLGGMVSDWWVVSLRAASASSSSAAAGARTSTLASLTRPLRAVAEWSHALWWQPRRNEAVVTAAGVVAAASSASSASGGRFRSSASASSGNVNALFAGLENRALLVAISCAVSAPIVVVALNAGFPDCFWFMVLSGLFGEVYFGITLTLLSELTPKRMTVIFVAVFSLCSIVIATMVQLLIPYLKTVFDDQLGPHTFLVLAAPTASIATSTSASLGLGGSSVSAEDEVLYAVEETGAAGLQRAMKCSLFSAYLAGAALYFAAYVWLKRDFRRSRGGF